MFLVRKNNKNNTSQANLIDTFFSDFLTPQSRYLNDNIVHSPKVDIVEKQKEFLVTAEIPGMKKEDVKLSLDNNSLTISGEKKEEKETKDGDYQCMERVFGSFKRTLSLPDCIKKDKVNAKYEDGILRITLPKTEQEVDKTKDITID